MSTATLERPKKVTDVTEVDVLEAAISQLEFGYTESAYFLVSDEHGSKCLTDTAGPNVGLTCAIGGVEQALWRLTGKVIDPDRERDLPTTQGKAYDKTYVSRLYAKVMKRLNAIAEQSPAAKQFDEGCPIEQLTFRRSKRTVVKAFRTALEQARAEA